MNTNLLRQSEEDKIVSKIRKNIDALHLHTNSLKDSILDLARYYDETKIYERNQICRKIKKKLQDKIKEGKITEKWIEDSLPQEYKRKYTKSEVSSVSNENKQEAGSCASTEFDTGDHQSSADSPIKRSPQNEIVELQRCENGFEISKNEVQFTIPRKKYENLKAAIEESEAAIYVVFKDGAFQYAYSDNAQT